MTSFVFQKDVQIIIPSNNKLTSPLFHFAFYSSSPCKLGIYPLHKMKGFCWTRFDDFHHCFISEDSLSLSLSFDVSIVTTTPSRCVARLCVCVCVCVCVLANSHCYICVVILFPEKCIKKKRKDAAFLEFSCFSFHFLTPIILYFQ